eukprot:CAMPEP_0203763792 /NCGR_PEP_ID=MMETSP0098-20131031/16874_1 /ASSEMBLY_ACC=CAM_ASM_000208 /TAXON_ID=96639 /ORGANISM=" , Strain NY0313808BC1" /LENGTH=618 /DNA_ID=CAMNT_0050659019 /DNA_START=231 /DNA_END=2087 /DNA_ORIENTATION=-
MGDTDGMVKLYFEEIPVVDDEGDDVFKAGPSFDSPPRPPATASSSSDPEVDKNATRSVELSGGGVLHDLRFDSTEFQSAEDDGGIKLALKSFCWDVSTCSEQSGELPARGGCTLSNLGEYIYIFGGASRDGTHFSDVWRSPAPRRLDPEPQGASSTVHNNQASNWEVRVKWENATTLILGDAPSGRSGHTATAFSKGDQHFVVYFGGLNAMKEEVYNDVHVLKSTSENISWLPIRVIGTPPQPRTEHSAVKLGSDRILIFGGSSPCSGVLRDVHVLDIGDIVTSENNELSRPLVCKWSTIRCGGLPPTPRELHSACIIGDLGEISPDLLSHYGCTILPQECRTLTEPCGESMDPEIKHTGNKLREDGNAFFVKGEYLQANDLYTKALVENPRDHLTYGNRSACHLQLGDPAQALNDAICAIRCNSRWAKGYYREAMALVALGDFNFARSALESAIELAGSERERQSMEKAKGSLYAEHKDAINNLKPNEAAPKLSLCIHGGRSNSNVLDTICKLDLSNLQWSEEPSPFPRCGHSCSALTKHKMLLFGGWDGGMNVFGTGTMYDFESSMWTECSNSSPIQKRFSHASCTAGSSTQILIFGGVSFEKDYADLISIDLELR